MANKFLAAALVFAATTVFAAEDLAGLTKLDPTTIWNRAELYKTPKTWSNIKIDDTMNSIFIEGEPLYGKKTRVFAIVGIPKGASKAKKVPAIVLVHGGGGTAYPSWVALWVSRGYAAIEVDNCGQLPIRGENNKWIANPNGGPRGWSDVAQNHLDEDVKDQWMYHAIAASVKAHSYLRSLECVDKTNIGVTGISWGGFQTCILAAVDDRFTYAVPVYGCGFNNEKWALGRKGEAKGLEMKWFVTWDAARFLPYAKIPFLWVDGTNDFAFSLDRVMRSAALMKGESQFCTRLRMRHAHGPAGEAPAEILAFADHYARGKADIVRFTESKIENGVLSAKFNDNGRKIVKAELMWTESAETVIFRDRKWEVKTIDDFKQATGKVTAKLTPATTQAIVNLTDDKGHIFSTPMLAKFAK